MEGFKGGRLATTGCTKVCVGIGKVGIVGVRTGSKSVSDFCKSSS